MLKNNKKLIIISLIIIILLVVLAIIFATTGSFSRLIKQENETEKMKGTIDFSYDVYSNEKGIVVGINVVEESGIKEIKYPNSDFTLYCNGRQRVSIDYKIEEKTDYIFKVTNENNEIKEHTLRIESIDDYIKIDVTTDKELDISGKVNVTYGVAGRTNQYAIGKNNNTWTNYSTELDIDSYTIMNKNLGNEDKTITIKARTLDSVGNIVQIEKTINCLDIDILTKPEITVTSDNAYPVLTKYGVQVQATIVDIEYDTRNDITNYYSLDGGLSWKEFTNSVKSSDVVCTGKIKAKSVKNDSGLEIQSSTDVTKLAPNAIAPAAYDGNEETSTQSTVDTYMIIDESMKGRKIYVNGDKKYKIELEDGTQTSIAIDENGIATLPETAAKFILLYYWPGQYNSRLKEIQVLNNPEIKPTLYYPKLTNYGVEHFYATAVIEYYETSVQRLYKIGDGEWKEYKGETIKLELGETLYAKGIDKFGKETRIVSEYQVSFPSDAIKPAAYDGNEETYTQSTVNTYMVIDESMKGKKIYVNGDKKYKIELEDGTQTSIAVDGNGIATLPETATKFILLYYWPGQYNSRLKEIQVLNNPEIKPTLHYPRLMSSGVEHFYVTAVIEYYETSVQRLYKIGDGEWKTYKGETIRLELGETLYAKGIDKFGKETRIISEYEVSFPNDAIKPAAYDGNETTSTQSTVDTYMVIDESMKGKKIYVSGGNNYKIELEDGTQTSIAVDGNGIATLPETAAKFILLHYRPGQYSSILREIRPAN